MEKNSNGNGHSKKAHKYDREEICKLLNELKQGQNAILESIKSQPAEHNQRLQTHLQELLERLQQTSIGQESEQQITPQFEENQYERDMLYFAGGFLVGGMTGLALFIKNYL
jgi:hypothetical protein